MALTLFQLASAGDDLRYFITMPWVFPNANSFKVMFGHSSYIFWLQYPVKIYLRFSIKGGNVINPIESFA